MSEFTVEITRAGIEGYASATLELPATWADYRDAMEKARITDDRAIYEVELCGTNRTCLETRIPAPVNLPELNLLAQRLAGLSSHQSAIFDAMVSIEAKEGKSNTLPLPRLINFTHSLDNCRVAPGVRSDKALGKWLFENGMLPQEVHDFAVARIFWGSETEDERFGLIGSRHRQRENGVYSGAGYVEMETVNEVYTPGRADIMEYFHRSGATVVLLVSKGFFNDPAYDNNRTVRLNMPAADYQINAAIDAVDAASEKEIGYQCIDCLIPSAKDLIDDAEDIGAANRFAEALADSEHQSSPVLLRAAFEAANPPDLESAAALVAQADQFTLDAEMWDMEDYARNYLSRLKGGDERIDLSSMINRYALAEKVLKLENAEWTSYGVLKRRDGGPIQAPEQGSRPVMGMEGIQ